MVYEKLRSKSFKIWGIAKMSKNWYELKVVKTRKDHECICCGEIIPKGSRTLVESGFNRDDGFFSNYFHIDSDYEAHDYKGKDCHLEYLDACQPNDLTIPDKLKDSTFFGQLIFNRWRPEETVA